MSNNRGHLLLVVLIFMGLIMFGLTQVVRMVKLAVDTQTLAIEHSKTLYLAQSGLNLAPSYLDEIPVYPIPPVNTKDWLYSNTPLFWRIPYQVDGSVTLVQSPNKDIYSIAISDGTYRKILTGKINEGTITNRRVLP